MKLDLLSFELDLTKARQGAMVGEERVWHGVTYVKTISGWRPKGKEKKPQQQVVSQPRVKKIEDPTKLREKQLEDYAARAKDSQLEAAIRDPKQDQEVKDIAQAELDTRSGDSLKEEKNEKGKKEEFKPDPSSLEILNKFAALKKELEETLKQKQEEKASMKETFKVIKKTGVSVDGHKIFITMNKDNTGYTAKGFGMEINSEKGELLSSFKERVKKELEGKFKEKEKEEETAKKQIEKETGTKLDKEFKPIETTSVKVEGKQVFVKREGDQYKASGQGVKAVSEPGESLKEFKEEVKKELEENLKKKKLIEGFKKNLNTAVMLGEEGAKELQESPLLANFENDEQFKDFLLGYFDSTESKYKYFNKYRNAKIKYDPDKKEAILDESAKLIESVVYNNEELKLEAYSKPRMYIEALLKEDNSMKTKIIMRSVSGEDSSSYYSDTGGDSLLIHQLAVQSALVSNDYEPICLPMNYLKYNGEEYNCYDRAFYKEDEYEIENLDEPGSVWEAYIKAESVAEATREQLRSLKLYAGNGFYRFITEYMLMGGDVSKMDKNAVQRGINEVINANEDGTDEATRKIILERAVEKAEEAIKNITSYIDKNTLEKNTIFSRRVNPTLNKEIYTQMAMLKKGDEGTFKSIQSFAYTQKTYFGEFQITLLGKKGDPIAPAFNVEETEFITKQNTRFRVVETGYNSIAIELLPENEE